MAKIFTNGSAHNCECPHCGKNNTYVCQGIEVVFRKPKHFQQTCFHCKKLIFYCAHWEIMVQAEKTNPLNPSKPSQGATS